MAVTHQVFQEQQGTLSKVHELLALDATLVELETGYYDQFDWMTVENGSNADVYVKIYNTANPTVGTTAPDMCIPVKTGVSVQVIPTEPIGNVFVTAMSIACVKHASDSDGPGTSGTTSPTGGDVDVWIKTSQS